MCFGGGGSQPQATVTTPAVPVDQISAGHPTVTVTPPKDPSASDNQSMTTSPKPASQSPGDTGLNSVRM